MKIKFHQPKVPTTTKETGTWLHGKDRLTEQVRSYEKQGSEWDILKKEVSEYSEGPRAILARFGAKAK